jgi:hypothetical protein
LAEGEEWKRQRKTPVVVKVIETRLKSKIEKTIDLKKEVFKSIEKFRNDSSFNF